MRTLSIALGMGAALLAANPAVASGGGSMGGGGMGAPSGPSGPTQADLEAAYNEGVAAVDAEDWKKAVSRFSFVTDAAPRSADAWNYLGYSTRKAGNPKRSEIAYKKALKIDPNHPRANEYYGELLLELNRVPEAEQRLAVLQACCAADPVTAQLATLVASAKANPPAAGAKPSVGY